MKYISTRGKAPSANLETVLLTGLAPDGGLYLPHTLPHFAAPTITSLAKVPYEEVALQILAPFFDGTSLAKRLPALIETSYATFRHPQRLLVKQLEPQLYLAELFHGPTYAFKDFALQFLATVTAAVLTQRKQNGVILGATSGDTGSAAIYAFKDIPHAKVIILHPHERTSHIQRKQMTTTGNPNVLNIAIAGTFDTCQQLVKACFNDKAFRTEIKNKHHSELIAVNSINWVRILAQAVYYFFIYSRILGNLSNFDRRASTSARSAALPAINFAVPTGNFGNVFAGNLAQRMGLPIKKLIVATNANDVLHQFFTHNVYKPKAITPTPSPSMDIAAASNFERLLYYACQEEPSVLTTLLASLLAEKSLTLAEKPFAAIKNLFTSTTTSNSKTLTCIEHCYQHYHYLCDPHTAVGIDGVAQFMGKKWENSVGSSLAPQQKTPSPAAPQAVQELIAVLATAHPAKFAPTIEKISRLRTHTTLHALASLHSKKESYTRLPNNKEQLKEEILAFL